jgi:hypothetical protein
VEALEDAIWELPWMSATTNTYMGLQHAENMYRQYGRAEVKVKTLPYSPKQTPTITNTVTPLP